MAHESQPRVAQSYEAECQDGPRHAMDEKRMTEQQHSTVAERREQTVRP